MKPISKQMDLTDRIVIEVGLHCGHSFKKIAKELGRHPSTIAHEVKANRMHIPAMHFHGNNCRRARQCAGTRKYLCGDTACKRSCALCKKYDCHELCKSYVARHCSKPDYPPYVCNRCTEKELCTNERFVYSAKHAQAYHERRLSESRQGLRISDKDMKTLDEMITKLINQGQPLAHIYAEHKDEIPVSLRSLYNYIDSGEMTIRNIDLRRKTTYRKRKRKRTKSKNPAYVSSCRIGRTYEDFTKYMIVHVFSIVIHKPPGRKHELKKITNSFAMPSQKGKH